VAHGISGGGFNAAQINAQFAKDLAKGDSAAATSARNNSGLTAQNKKGAAPANKQVGGEESGITLSDAARQQIKSETEHHAEFVAEHADELAQQAGLYETEDSPEQAELQRKRGYDRQQEELGESALAPGFVQLQSPTGEVQVVSEELAIKLNTMDDPDYTDSKLLDDIPDANLQAANATLETQMSKGVSKVAEFKSDPKIDAVAETMEVEPVQMLSEPMDIVGPGNDKLSGPMTLDFPPEMERVAAEKAASELAAGQEQEVFIAGLEPPASEATKVEAIDLEVVDDEPKVSRFVDSEMPPPHINQAGQTQAPVKPSFMQRLRYMFSGNPAHIGGSLPPYPSYSQQIPGPAYGQPSQNPYGFMQNQGMTGGSTLTSMLMMMSMFTPYSSFLPMAMFMNMMPQPWTTPPFNPYQPPMGYQPYPQDPMAQYGQMSAPGQPMATTAPSYRYDPTPTRPGSVVILDTFRADRSNSTPAGDVAMYAMSKPAGDVARMEIARPAIDVSWLTVPQQQATPQQIRDRMQNELAESRVRMLDGATQSLRGLEQEGLRNSAINMPPGPSTGAEVWATYGGLRQAWEADSSPTSGSRIALDNYCRAFGLDASKVIHKDPSISEPARAKLQQALVKLSEDAANSPQVKQSQQQFAQSVESLADKKVSVVVAAGEQLGTDTMASDRGAAKLDIGDNYHQGIFSVPGAVKVGASFVDEDGVTKPWTKTESVDILADSTLKGQDGTATSQWGSQAAAPRVSTALAALHARHPDKGNSEILSMLQSGGSEPVAGDKPVANMQESKLKTLLA